jgi:hypothetical protein
MPEISRFYGISVCFYPREHPPAHFHALYAEHEAVFNITTLRLIEGWLPNRARSLVLDWAAQHRDELFTAWEQIRSGQTPAKIAPLE